MSHTVVFLHAGSVSGVMWQEQVAALPDRPTFAPDLPGYGSRRDEPWTSFDSVVDRLAVEIADLSAEPVDLVGLSLGAITGLHLAARHPKLINSVFATGTSVLPYPPAMRLGNRILLALWDRPFIWRLQARAMGFGADAARIFVEQAPPVSRSSAREQLREVQRGALTPLQMVTAPVLALAGEREPAYFHRSLREIERTIPDVRAKLAPGMHHAWNAEDPGLFNRTLRAWLDERAVHPDLIALPGIGAPVRS